MQIPSFSQFSETRLGVAFLQCIRVVNFVAYVSTSSQQQQPKTRRKQTNRIVVDGIRNFRSTKPTRRNFADSSAAAPTWFPLNAPTSVWSGPCVSPESTNSRPFAGFFCIQSTFLDIFQWFFMAFLQAYDFSFDTPLSQAYMLL